MKYIYLVIFILFIIGFSILQKKLSKRKNKLYGLILPITFFITTTSISILSTPINTTVITSVEVIDEESEIVEHETNSISNQNTNILLPNFPFTLTQTIIVSNIFTLYLIAIYFYERSKYSQKNALKLMKINDLE